MNTASIVIAVIAIMISGFVAWRNYLSPFHLVILTGLPIVRIDFIKDPEGGEIWYILSLFLTVSFVNERARSGQIQYMRIKLQAEHGDDKLFLPSTWFVDYSWNLKKPERRERLKSIEEDWHPLFLQRRQEIMKHIVFETRLDTVTETRYAAELQVLSSGKPNWHTYAYWTIPLPQGMIEQLLAGASMTGAPSNLGEMLKEP